jgi:DivIVA domain-containing protein
MGIMEITPRELRDIEIKESLRGYNRDEVNELLERAAASLEAANERVRQLSERLSSAQTEAGRTRETEDILHRTLLLAQRAADEAVSEATAKARQMVDDAEIQSRRVIAEAESDARRRGELERRRLEEEVVDLAGRRDALLEDVDALQRFESEYRERMTRSLESDLTALRTRATAAPGSRPEPTEVELPVMPEAFAGRESESAPAVTESETASSGSTDLPSAPVAPPMPEAANGSIVPTLAPVDEATADDADDGNDSEARVDDRATREVDVRSLFEASDDMIPSASTTTATSSSTDNAFDLLGGDAIDAEVLDDDAFFATLREAVHDEAPLGPRDEEELDENRFFDQDADRGSFRDVFRRRR